MKQKTFSAVAGTIFALVALAHLSRALLGWTVVVGGWPVPLWVSWVGFVVAGALGYVGLSQARR